MIAPSATSPRVDGTFVKIWSSLARARPRPTRRGLEKVRWRASRMISRKMRNCFGWVPDAMIVSCFGCMVGIAGSSPIICLESHTDGPTLIGGGFCLPINPDQHLTFLSGIQTTFENAKTPVGVAVLAYCACISLLIRTTQTLTLSVRGETALTPSSPFPTQLRQATAAVKHLLAKGVSPSNLIIGGDSAGGNLALQFLSHALHPLPGIPPPPTFPSPLAGVLLISHWASFHQELPSFKRNDKKDNISCETIATFMTVSARGIEPGQEPWFEPMASDVEWWRGLGGLVTRMMSTVGEVECLRDPIEEFAKTRLGPNVGDLTCLVEKNGVHTDFLCDIAVGEGRNNAAHRDVVLWLQDTFCKP